MRWFRGSAEKKFKGKMRTRKKPVPPQTLKPKYKSPAVVHRVPPIQKPVVDIPFSKPADLNVVAVAPYERVFSLDALRDLDRANPGQIVEIEWNGEPSAFDKKDSDCANYVGSTWSSVSDFLGERRTDRHRNVSTSGITGVTHPGCRCHLTVTLRDGSIYKIQVGDPSARLVGKTEPAAVEPVEEEIA